MDPFIKKIRSFKNELRKERCEELGVPFIQISDSTMKEIDEVNHILTMAQLEAFGVVTNVRYENGRKVIIN